MIIAAARYPARTVSSILLAQAAEFSFFLARIGVDHGAVSAGVFSLELAAAVASVIVGPLLYQAE